MFTETMMMGVSSRYGHLGFHGTFDVARRFSKEQILEAFDATVQDFPVMGCRYEKRLWRDRWVPMESPTTDAVHILPSEDLDADTRHWVHQTVDPTQERPVRLVVLEHEGGCRLLMSVMHVFVDGGGAMAVAQSLSAHLYGVSPAVPASRRRELKLALERVRWFHIPVILLSLFWVMGQGVKWLWVRSRDRPYETDPGSKIEWSDVQLSASEFRAFKAHCKGRGATINDGLLAVLALVSRRFSSKGPVGVGYTKDLRRYMNSPRLVATNLSVLLFVFVPRAQLHRFDDALRAVTRTTKRQRRYFPGLAALLMLTFTTFAAPHGFVRWGVPIFMDLLAGRMLRRAMALTNIGRLDDGVADFGDDLKSINIISPVVENNPSIVFSAIGFKEGLSLHLSCPPGMAEASMETYVSAVRTTLREICQEMPPDSELT